MITLPKNGQFFVQSSDSDVEGDLFISYCLDTTSNQGRLRAGRRMILNTGSDDVTEITGVPIAFINNTGSVFTFAGANDVGYAFKNDATMVGTFAKDTSTGHPTTIDSAKSDACFSNNAIYVSAKASASSNISLYKKTFSGNWSEITTTENQNNVTSPNMVCSYGTRTYMTNQFSKIISLDSSDSVTYSGSYTLTVGKGAQDASNVITKLLPSDDRIFITCLNLYGGQGYVYEWDGVATSPNYQHVLESSGALAGIIFEGTPYIVDTDARLLAWNGGTFVEVAKFNREHDLPLKWTTNYSGTNLRFIHPNGMSVVDGKIQLLINNLNADANSTIEETIPSGIYEFDPKNPSKGLIHKQAISFNKATDIVTNYGQIRLGGVGALDTMNIQSTATDANGTVFAGASYYSDATTQKYGIFYDDRNDTLQKSAHLVTTKLLAQGAEGVSAITNTFKSIYTFFKRLVNPLDKIAIKYRVLDVEPVEATITWTSTTTFTTTTDISLYEGYECEVIQGIGSGKSSKITSITQSGGTYTVTLEDSFYGATGTSKARFQYWIKLSPEIQNQTDNFQQTDVGVPATWIQFKVSMLFTGKQEVEKLVVVNSVNQIAE